MAGGAGTFERLVNFVGDALGPLGHELSDPDSAARLLAELGLDLLPIEAVGLGNLQRALEATAATAVELQEAVENLAIAIRDESALDIVRSGASAFDRIQDTIGGIHTIADELGRVPELLPDLTSEQQAQLRTFADRLALWLVNHLVLRLIGERAPQLLRTVGLIGLLDLDEAILPLAEEFTDPEDPDHLIQEVVLPSRQFRTQLLHLDLLKDLLKQPERYLQQVFQWGLPAFDGVELFHRIAAFLDDPSIAVVQPSGGLPAVLVTGLFNVTTDRSTSPAGLKFTVHRAALADFSHTIDVSELWSFRQERTGRFAAGLEAGVFPPFDIKLLPPTGEASLDLKMALETVPQPEPMLLFGQTGKTRIEIEAFRAELQLEAEWNGALRPPAAELTPVVTFAIDGGKVVIDTSDGDSFLSFLTGGAGGETTFSLSATWTPDGGLKFDGSSSLEIALPSHGSIGPVLLKTIYLRSGIGAGGEISIGLSGAIAGSLGPLSVTVDSVGVLVEARFPEHGGNLGPIDIGVEFQAPNAIGLELDGGGFRGGGFLFLDPASGEYGGNLEFSFQDAIDVKAVGILNTRLPDGGEGFSLLLIITTEFPPIQLGFGFTLLGVGGLLGLNRTMQIDVLRSGLRDGSLESVLFANDAVANAPRIINGLQRVFPPLDDRFLIGPMARLGWGTPTIVDVEFGIFLEIPRSDFAIAGVLRVNLPTEEAAILKIQVDFLGIVDFEKQRLLFDASLYDSYVLQFPLTGDMALRIFWGDNANFLLTVGGFHPSYTPPPMGLGPLSPLTIQVFQGNPTVRAEAYFAVTSNTVQFGGRLEVYAGISVFNVYGFLSLDVLIQLDPFHFVADIAAMLAVRSGSAVLFSVRLQLMLEGPAPWHARGRASFEVGFIITVTISVHFDVRVGEERTTTLPRERVLPLIQAAFMDDRNWQAIGPLAHSQQVALRDFSSDGVLVFQPDGILAATEKIAPLNIPLQRFGAKGIEGGNTFSISRVMLGDEDATERIAPVQEQFAPSQYFDMNDTQKLSSESFKKFDAGMVVTGSEAARADFVREVEVVYEVIYLHQKTKLILFKLAQLLLDAFILGSAAAKSALGFAKKKPSGLGTPKVALLPEMFAIVAVKDLRLHQAHLVFATQTQSRLVMNGIVAGDPGLTGKLQVVPAYEVNA